MTMKCFVWIALLIVILLALLSLQRIDRRSDGTKIDNSPEILNRAVESEHNDAIAVPAAVTPPAAVYAPALPVHPLTGTFGTPAFPPEREPEILLEIFDAYRRTTGSYPVAEDNRQIMYMLTGGSNSDRGVFPRTHARMNQQGELIDGWGTPFFFHCISRTHIEIRSAGPDATFYTQDDIVVPQRPVDAPM